MGAREPEKPTPPLTQVRREGCRAYGLPSRSYAGGIVRWAGRKAGQRGRCWWLAGARRAAPTEGQAEIETGGVPE